VLRWGIGAYTRPILKERQEMGYRFHPLGIQVLGNPAEAIKHIVEAHRKTGGNTVQAAVLLDVSSRNLARWIDKLDIMQVITNIRETARTGEWPEGEDDSLLQGPVEVPEGSVPNKGRPRKVAAALPPFLTAQGPPTRRLSGKSGPCRFLVDKLVPRD
jgi:hypothetical protein